MYDWHLSIQAGVARAAGRKGVAREGFRVQSWVPCATAVLLCAVADKQHQAGQLQAASARLAGCFRRLEPLPLRLLRQLPRRPARQLRTRLPVRLVQRRQRGVPEGEPQDLVQGEFCGQGTGAAAGWGWAGVGRGEGVHGGAPGLRRGAGTRARGMPADLQGGHCGYESRE